jgi:BirA family transcriptional regulator, biotin operon repressor / biotin---[acetyl-CoA-carboxylase] ligase
LHKSFNNTIFIGKQVIHLPTCHSTNDVALEMANKNLLFDGAIVITDNQTAGKGQRGNNWEAESSKNLTFSLLLKPSFLNINNQFYLNILTSLAVIDTLEGIAPLGFTIKWPNDIFFNSSKIGGILIENVIKNNHLATSIIGIGLNINQLNFINPVATSLAKICNQNFDIVDVLTKLLPNIEKKYFQLKNGHLKLLKDEYFGKMYRFNEWHIFNDGSDFYGKIIGVDEWGRIQIEKADGVKLYDIKEVKFI